MAVESHRQAVANLRRVIGAVSTQSDKILVPVGIEVTNRWKQKLSQPGSGRTYKRRGRGLHRASAPGDPPAVDTGLLRSTVDWAVRRLGAIAELSVGSSDKRFRWFEYGTSKMLPRPSLRPVVEETRGRVAALIAFGVAHVQRAAVSGIGGRVG